MRVIVKTEKKILIIIMATMVPSVHRFIGSGEVVSGSLRRRDLRLSFIPTLIWNDKEAAFQNTYANSPDFNL